MLGFHLGHDRSDQAVPRSEVVVEHSMAGTHGCGQVAKAPVAEAMASHLIDDSFEQVLSSITH